MDTGQQKHLNEGRRFTSRVKDPSTGDLSSGTGQSLVVPLVPLVSASMMGTPWLIFLLSPLDETFMERAAQGSSGRSREVGVRHPESSLHTSWRCKDRTRTNSRSHRDPTHQGRLPGGKSFLKAWRWAHQTTTGPGEWDAEVGVEGLALVNIAGFSEP